ncbi:unnamed protein product [Choristocarpus tenellus]
MAFKMSRCALLLIVCCKFQSSLGFHASPIRPRTCTSTSSSHDAVLRSPGSHSPVGLMVSHINAGIDVHANACIPPVDKPSKLVGRLASASALAFPATMSFLSGVDLLFLQGLALSSVLSSGGFRVKEHFVSYGYGLSMFAQAALGLWLFRDTLTLLQALHTGGVLAYGLRLSLFCLWREGLESFQKRPKRVAKPTSGGSLAVFWGSCSTLYALLFLPCLHALRRLPAAQGFLGISQFGIFCMAVGLLLETVGDYQKSAFKEKQPQTFCDMGLYRLCRHPNYLGEIVWWGGCGVASPGACSAGYHWAFGFLGTFQIFSTIARATKGLEGRQEAKYKSDPLYLTYTSTVPVLFPWTQRFQWGTSGPEVEKG